MKTNVGNLDKYIRIVAGLVVAGLGFYFSIWPLYLVAAALIVTAFTGFCGLYAVFGLSTCPRKKA
jgi:phage shock protein PspC (stress-responsive transcriptional regulator)